LRSGASANILTVTSFFITFCGYSVVTASVLRSAASANVLTVASIFITFCGYSVVTTSVLRSGASADKVFMMMRVWWTV
jgi:hypothetical protein